MHSLFSLYQQAIIRSQTFSGIAPLLLRLYHAPVFAQAGWNKYQHFDNTVAWFANTDWGLGLPAPALLAALAIAAETLGAVFLLLGLFTRLVSIPLLITMLVAIFAVHWPNGWLAIADNSSWLAGDLVEVLPEMRLSSPLAYWLLVAPRSKLRPEVSAFCDWLRQQAHNTRLATGDVPDPETLASPD